MQHSSVPAPTRRLVIATANPGKLREFRALLEGLPYETVSLASLNLPSPEETGTSFLENAILKARHAAALSGSAAVADDSGLEVDALGGAPGIYSARFAGAGADDAANNTKLMEQLHDVPDGARIARYRCALVFVDSAHAAPLIAEAVWEGRILDAPRGLGGFGYDAYFWLPAFEKTAAELDADEKNRWSHRAVAMRSLREQLKMRGPAAPREPLQ
jgi:XTP/dITP diphosphohydrolase